MKLELNKLLEKRIYNHKECVCEIEKIADKYTIDFAKWCDSLEIGEWSNETVIELFEIYKKNI
jgi:hypothetical protein